MFTDSLNLFAFFLLLIVIILEYINIHRLKKRNNSLRESHIEICNKLGASENKQRKLLDQIRQLEWQLANPPKFKKGDKIGDLIITSYAYHTPSIGEVIGQAVATLFFGVILGRTEEDRNALTKDFKSKTSAHYLYEVTHTITGHKETKTESELEAFSAEQKS